jgi:hypothetical protein
MGDVSHFRFSGSENQARTAISSGWLPILAVVAMPKRSRSAMVALLIVGADASTNRCRCHTVPVERSNRGSTVLGLPPFFGKSGAQLGTTIGSCPCGEPAGRCTANPGTW